MRKSPQSIGLLAALGVLLVASHALAQQEDVNRVADGDFENGFVSLSLPASAHFPMFSGGWASRGGRAPEVVNGDAYEGALSLRLVSRPTDPLQIIQDLPVNSSSYGMRFAFLIEDGDQTIRLLDGWDRGSPASGTPAFEARISSAGIDFATPAGSWRVTTPIAPLEWHALSVIADPRTGTHSVRLDGVPLMALPGVSTRRPSTIIFGGVAGASGTFRYDAVEVMSLVDLELATIRDGVARLDIPTRDAVLDRLAAAGAALTRGSETLALPELGVARNMLGTSALATENLRRALADLIELIEASSENAQRRRAAQF
jgi:hypothetical protein